MINEPCRLLITNAWVVTPTMTWKPGWLLVEDTKIRLMAPGMPPSFGEGMVTERIDAGGHTLLPGFIDLHVHGAVGYELMDSSLEGLHAMTEFYARHGVTGVLPTTWTAGPGETTRALDIVQRAMNQPTGKGATILGVHMEGPFLNPVRCGAQDSTFIRTATPDEVLPYLETGIVRLMTLAPEMEGSDWLIDELQRRGITISAGHTSAGYELMKKVSQRGVR